MAACSYSSPIILRIFLTDWRNRVESYLPSCLSWGFTILVENQKGGEDPLEKGMATHTSTPALRIPWTEEPGGLQSIGSQSWTWLKRLSTAQGFPRSAENWKTYVTKWQLKYNKSGELWKWLHSLSNICFERGQEDGVERPWAYLLSPHQNHNYLLNNHQCKRPNYQKISSTTKDIKKESHWDE